MILLAALTAAAAAFLAVYTLTTPSGRRGLTERLDRFDRQSQMDRDTLMTLPFTVRVGRPAADQIRGTLARLLPGSLLEAIERRLVAAGEPISLFAFSTMQGLAALGGLFVVLLAFAGDRPAVARLAMLMGGLVVALVPLYWLRIRVATRRKSIEKALPDALDLLVTTVEAGMSIDAALAEVGHETEGPLGEELRIAVRETTLGRGRREALLRLSERLNVPDLRTFIQAVVQAEQTGIPIGPVLRTQAAQMRLRKRQRAETEAQRAPVKMIVVLVLLVLPVMLMLVMGPALIRINEGDLF